jgi:predicted enzyme related to lactoylglutathione lyase
MQMEVLFAGVAVRNFTDAVDWYDRFFDRSADIVPHDTEVMWRIADGAWLYVVEDAARAGKSLAAIAVSDVDQAVAELKTRRISDPSIESVGDGARKATFTDPDGNSIALIQVPAG